MSFDIALPLLRLYERLIVTLGYVCTKKTFTPRLTRNEGQIRGPILLPVHEGQALGPTTIRQNYTDGHWSLQITDELIRCTSVYGPELETLTRRRSRTGLLWRASSGRHPWTYTILQFAAHAFLAYSSTIRAPIFESGSRRAPLQDFLFCCERVSTPTAFSLLLFRV